MQRSKRLPRSYRPALIAGVLAGVCGLAVFLALHALWIVPIWFIAPTGLLLAALGGLLMGWSYHELLAGLPPRPWTAPAVAGLSLALLLPAELLTLIRGPLSFDQLSALAGPVVLRFLLELVLGAILVGASAGWLLGRSGRAAASTALAGALFALGPGHNVPVLGASWSALGMAGMLLLITLCAACVLVELQLLLGRRWP